MPRIGRWTSFNRKRDIKIYLYGSPSGFDLNPPCIPSEAFFKKELCIFMFDIPMSYRAMQALVGWTMPLLHVILDKHRQPMTALRFLMTC